MAKLTPRQKFRQAVEEETDKKQVLAVWTAVRLKALDGKAWACKLFLEYTLGKPDQNINLSSESAIRLRLSELSDDELCRIVSNRE